MAIDSANLPPSFFNECVESGEEASVIRSNINNVSDTFSTWNQNVNNFKLLLLCVNVKRIYFMVFLVTFYLHLEFNCFFLIKLILKNDCRSSLIHIFILKI